MATEHATPSAYDVLQQEEESTILVNSMAPVDLVSVVSLLPSRAHDTVVSRQAPRALLDVSDSEGRISDPAAPPHRTRFQLTEIGGHHHRYRSLKSSSLRMVFLSVIMLVTMGLSLLSWATPGDVLLVGGGLALMWLGFFGGVVGIYGVGILTGYYFIQPRKLILVLAMCLGLALAAIWSAVRLAGS